MAAMTKEGLPLPPWKLSPQSKETIGLIVE
jgi:hypothetical protein